MYNKYNKRCMTILAAVLWIVALVVILECGARSKIASNLLPEPILGSSHPNLDPKFIKLDSFVKDKGGIDCILLGNSTVNRDINPLVLNEYLEEKTGQSMRCFNFGVAGLTHEAAKILIKVLRKRYNPNIFIYGTSVSDYYDKSAIRSLQVVKGNPWIRFCLGEENLEGRLIEHSLSYRYFLRFRIWLERPELSVKLSKHAKNIRSDGFEPSRRFRDPGEFKTRTRLRRQIAKWSRFESSTTRLNLFEDLLRVTEGTTLIVVDMPVHPECYSSLGYRVGEVERVLSNIEYRTKQHGAFFIRTRGLNFIPIDCWADYHHMNYKGAEIFSRWLAEQIANMLPNGFQKKRQSNV